MCARNHSCGWFGICDALLLLTVLLVGSCTSVTEKNVVPTVPVETAPGVLTGLDRLERQNFGVLQSKTIGLVVNQTSVDRAGTHLIDLLLRAEPKLNLKIIFTPEHGLSGLSSAGEMVADSVLGNTGIRIISLYGKKKIPRDDDLAGLDILLFDIQGVGSRYYTYISTLTNILKAAAQNHVKVIVLDRPNPLGGDILRGPVIKNGYESYVGMHPIPIRYGMTMGELARMINASDWLGAGSEAELKVVQLANWQRKHYWPDTGLPWRPTSPNIPDFETALIYNGLCLLEGTNVSEGRGTLQPFKIFGAPWIHGDLLSVQLNKLKLPGVRFSEADFIPVSIPDKSRWPKYEDQYCRGCRIELTDLHAFDPLATAVHLLVVLQREYPLEFQFLSTNYIDKLYGSDQLRVKIIQGDPAMSIIADWSADEAAFRLQRKKYLLY